MSNLREHAQYLERMIKENSPDDDQTLEEKRKIFIELQFKVGHAPVEQ